jgi:hypothetical protein
MKWLGIMLMAGLLAGGPGYGSAAQPAPKGTPAVPQSQGPEVKGGQVQAAKTYSPKDRKEYQNKIDVDLAQIQKRIEDLRGKVAKVVQQKRRTFRMALVDIERKDVLAQGRLAALKKAPEKDWSGMTADMDKAVEELGSAIANAEAFIR